MVLKLKTTKTSRREEIISDYRIRYLLNRFAKVTQRSFVKTRMVTSILKWIHCPSPPVISFPFTFDWRKSRPSIPWIRTKPAFPCQLQHLSEVKFSFTDKESHGKFLNPIFNLFVHIQGISKTDYVTFLSNLHTLDGLPNERRHQETFSGFVHRTRSGKNLWDLQRNWMNSWKS